MALMPRKQMVLTCLQRECRAEGTIQFTLLESFDDGFSGEDELIASFGRTLRSMATMLEAIQMVALDDKPEVAKKLTAALLSRTNDMRVLLADEIRGIPGLDSEDILAMLSPAS